MPRETWLSVRMHTLGVSAGSLSDRSGVPLEVVRSYMDGEPGNMKVWTRLASAMRVEVTEIVGRVDGTYV